MPNRLASEKSPYLLQHAHNPVDWYPWGEAAFAAARARNRPIFLSAGYSTCHWCHVMERESFEDSATAALMNELFINIKVDREERPDVDRLYMTYVQAVTGQGGWPMSVFLTPDLRPFYGGTYFPPRGAWGRPGFPDLLRGLAKAWDTDRESVERTAGQSLRALEQFASAGFDGEAAAWESIEAACYAGLRDVYDATWGGFGAAPKFPRPVVHDFLHAWYAFSGDDRARAMSEHTLAMMAGRGMNDQLGGGFHRYSVDGQWVVPHFEKMLYDQAQLVISLLEIGQITGNAYYHEVAERTLRYVWRDLSHVEGAFFAGEDADSLPDAQAAHKEEGAFYVWTQKEIQAELEPASARLFCDFYGIKAKGNAPKEGDPHGEFADKNILFEDLMAAEAGKRNGLTVRETLASLESSREKLLEARARRQRPHRDEKIIVAWNGLMISAFARAASVLDNHRYGRIAAGAAEFLWRELWDGASLKRHWKEGPADVTAFADDYAALARACLDLFEYSFEVKWLVRGRELLTALHTQFWDEIGGGYFGSAPDPSILVRLKDDYDGAEPSANALAACAWAKLHQLTGDEEARSIADRICAGSGARLSMMPTSMPLLLCARMLLDAPPEHIVICGEPGAEDTLALLRAAREPFLPFASVIVLGAEAVNYLSEGQPFLAAMAPVEGRAAAYVCRDFTCLRPETDAGELRRTLAGADAGPR